MSNYDDLQPDLQPVIDQLRANRPEASALELDAIKQRVRTRSSQPARRRTTRRAQLMKSRLVILTMLVLGMLMSTAGAGLAISGGSGNAAESQYGAASPTPSGGGNVLGEEDQGSGTKPVSAAKPPSTGRINPVQPARQVEAGVGNTESGTSLPFTGFAAIPILLGGIVLLTTGLLLRRRTSGDKR
jgi:hypothetical protein